jgi:dTMP kinase
MDPKPGRFITLEGIEGAGKTTQLAYIRGLLEMAGKRVVSTREPGGTPLGDKLRGLLLDPENAPMSEQTELLLMFAARCEHLVRAIRPALERGDWVLSDRFSDASYAYQGGGRQMGLDRVRALDEWVGNELRPDLTLLLDIPVALGMHRARRRSNPDRFESEQQAFFERVRASYLELAAAEPGRFRVIRSDRELSAVQEEIQAVIRTLLTLERP